MNEGYTKLKTSKEWMKKLNFTKKDIFFLESNMKVLNKISNHINELSVKPKVIERVVIKDNFRGFNRSRENMYRSCSATHLDSYSEYETVITASKAHGITVTDIITLIENGRTHNGVKFNYIKRYMIIVSG